MRISDLSSDVCASDLWHVPAQVRALVQGKDHLGSTTVPLPRIAFHFDWSMCPQPARRRGRPEGRGHPDLSGPRKIRTSLVVDVAESRRSRKRSETHRVGKERVSTCSSGWWT